MWLVEEVLEGSLGRVAVLQVEDVEPVSCINFHTESLSVGLVESLADTAIIVEEEPPVVDELDHSLLEGGRAGLRPLIHDRDLDTLVHTRAVLLDISHGDG